VIPHLCEAMYTDPVYCPDQCTANACGCHIWSKS